MTATAQHPTDARDDNALLFRFMLLSLAAALTTMALKTAAATLTGSVGFLSDALESSVNLVAAVVGLIALHVAARPPDHNHDFGHGKAEYFSAAVEGAMILVAAAAIGWTSVDRLVDPVQIERPALGLLLTTIAALVNLIIGLALLHQGRRYRSITLVADGRHLLTDVWTSAGVLVGIALVALTGRQWLDPVVALAVGANILVTGYRLLRRSLTGLLDSTLPPDDLARIETVLRPYLETAGVDLTSLRTAESGRQRFVALELAVPRDWTVADSHDLTDRIEHDLAAVLTGCTTLIHVEPDDGPPQTPHRAVAPGGKGPR